MILEVVEVSRHQVLAYYAICWRTFAPLLCPCFICYAVKASIIFYALLGGGHVWLERRSPLLLPFGLPSQGNPPSRLSGERSAASTTGFYAVGSIERLNRYRKWIDLGHYTILTKDERLVVTTMLLHNSAERLF